MSENPPGPSDPHDQPTAGRVDELADEAARWDRGEFADGTWVDAPEAIIANQHRFYLTGEDGVQRAIIRATRLGTGMFFERGRGGDPLISLARGQWKDLSNVQRTGLCQLIWAGTHDGEFVVIEAPTDKVIGTHTIAAVAGAPC